MIGKRILIVDDEATARMLISEFIDDEKCVALEAGSGRKALEIIKKESPDLVLLDYKLPDIDGLEVLANIRSKNPTLPVIVFSAHGDVKSAVRALKLGAYDFLEKPLDANKLLVTMRNALWNIELEDEVTRLKQELGKQYRMVGSSEVMQELRKRI
ncbi:response regulator, partial [candidate division WOR-3 bacterium]|nr:response regulator [candidate division WOR-3 bacterium]